MPWSSGTGLWNISTGSLFRVRRHGTDVQYVEKIEVGYRIRDITFMPDGRIALLEDNARVHFLSRSLRNRRDVYSINCESSPHRHRWTHRVRETRER